jgi:hypothetical protein
VTYAVARWITVSTDGIGCCRNNPPRIAYPMTVFITIRGILLHMGGGNKPKREKKKPKKAKASK